jgi:hypothetical protein
MLISNRLKKFYKNSNKKVFSKTKLTKMSKSKKMHISVMLLLITFFVWKFLTFNGLKLASNLAFFDYKTLLTNAQIFFNAQCCKRVRVSSS